jgi:thioredoxin-dependent peroxiredoxin
VLGASYDATEKNQAFCEKFDFPFKLLTFDKTSGAAWDATDPADPDWPRRITYLIGPDHRIVKAYDSVEPAAHPAEVLADLRALPPR